MRARRSCARPSAGYALRRTALKKHGFAPIGAADGPVKIQIFSRNSARLYRIDVKMAQGAVTADAVAAIKAEHVAQGGMRSNARYGHVHRA